MTPPAISKAGRVMPNMRKMSFPAKREGHENDEAGDGSFARHALLTLLIRSCGDGQESGNRGEGIDEKEDGGNSQHGEAHVVRMQRVDRDARRAIHAIQL